MFPLYVSIYHYGCCLGGKCNCCGSHILNYLFGSGDGIGSCIGGDGGGGIDVVGYFFNGGIVVMVSLVKSFLRVAVVIRS